MKRALLVLLLALAAFPIIALRTAVRTGTDVLRQLSISEAEAHDCIWSSFSGKYLSLPNVKALRAIARGERATVVRAVGALAKEYAKSDDFARRYGEYRENKKPAPPTPPKSVDQLKEEQRQSLTKSLNDVKESMKSMNDDSKESMKGVVEALETQLKSIDDPNNPVFSKDMETMMQQSYEMQKQEYQKSLDQWAKDYPVSSSGMVRAWLNKFLEVSTNVDYSAQLKDGLGATKIFTNPDYEAKPSEWKMCYRAGKETVEAGRAFAQSWIKDLEKGQ